MATLTFGSQARAPVELRLFHLVLGLILVIPVSAGAVGAFGGLEALARLLGADPHLVVAPSLRNHLRAVCWEFFVIMPTVVWTLRSLIERASGFRVVVGFTIGAGLARLTGWVVDGYPGWVPLGILGIELGVLPLVLLWHTRLVRIASHSGESLSKAITSPPNPNVPQAREKSTGPEIFFSPHPRKTRCVMD